MIRAPILLGVFLLLAACTVPPEPPGPLERDTYISLCTAWDMAYARLRETGDTLALDPAVVQQAEMNCSGIAEPAP
ncbi:MAG TPA: hypothetical protein VGR27_05790 [Longimicrobiaceae bacterium]|nr:hypothetical protein [Longimicrobiaceae bacterium]